MRRYILVFLMAVSTLMAGCAPGLYVDSVSSQQTIIGPDGRVMRAYSTQTRDMTGSVAANAATMAAGVAAGVVGGAADAMIRTNFGRGYRTHGRFLHGGYGTYGYPYSYGGSYGYAQRCFGSFGCY